VVTGSPGVPAIDATSAAARLDGGALLLDVREPDEWTAGHAPAAVWIPMREVAARQGELPTDRDIVVVCRVGSRSARVTDALRRAGYEATNLAGGMQAWATAGLPIVTDAGDEGVVA
jgi:rhodanese-related sulfurtransferase